MLTTLATIKARLGIAPADIQNDTLLTNAIAAVSARFDLETNRTLARTVDATHEFPADEVHIVVPCYPIETVTRFETKTSELEGWTEQSNVRYVLRNRCVISLDFQLSTLNPQLSAARLTYTAGYVLPGAVPAAGQTALPAELEQAAVEQVAFWFQTRNTTGAIRIWPAGGNYTQFADIDLIPGVRSVLRRHTRFLL